MLTIGSTLAIFLILGISSLALFWAKRLNLPHTVLLVIIGMGLGLLSYTHTFAFFGEFNLTPELLFYLLLPTLIFESAYNINARRMVEDAPIILILAIIGLLVSTGLIAGGLYYLLPFLGMEIPFMVALLFGALISATDPVAVLALFKEYGAPRRLSLIFEGESLFNDATAVALFLILLEVARFGYHGVDTIVEGTLTFLSMLIGGVIFGIIIGAVFAKIVGWSRENEVASITLTIVLAHITFIMAELLSHHLVIGGFHFYLSPIIATTIAALLMGNYGRSKIHPRAEEFVEKLWGQLAFWANSLIFILIGVLFVGIPSLSTDMIIVVLVTILVVAIARAISIYPVVEAFNAFVGKETKVPMSWQHLLSWGSLRGALAVTMVLLIPDDLTFEGWTLALSPKEFLLALTVGCIAATLFIKATTIQKVMKKLKLDVLTDIEKVEAKEARALIHHEVQERIKTYEERGYVDPIVAAKLYKQHQDEFLAACADLNAQDTKELALRVLRMYAVGIEKMHLKQLYHYNEVNERVFRRLTGKLQLQLEAVEVGNLAPNMSIHSDGKDVFEHMANKFRAIFETETEEQKVDNNYLYYRAQTIISRKVLKELQTIDTDSAEHIFTKEALTHVLELYTTFKNQSEKKMNELASAHPERYRALSEKLALYGINKIEEHTLTELYERQLITPKLYITLAEELK
ncbi:MAG: sodium:proton antiporter [Candidatus Pacebacteria bacterium]|nr:sodium:proton antiporter [Candidatus Paceibacterota bacterium]MBP9842629.1 sodium:proton antiporter [Candidatus Paceibacterota bacterium]